MDWNNIDLNSPYERDQNILDGYSFETLLLEVYTNIPTEKLSKETIKAQFEETLKMNVNSAREIFESNLDNILKYAKKERK